MDRGFIPLLVATLSGVTNIQALLPGGVREEEILLSDLTTKRLSGKIINFWTPIFLIVPERRIKRNSSPPTQNWGLPFSLGF